MLCLPGPSSVTRAPHGYAARVHVAVTDDAVEVHLARWQKALGLMKDIRVDRGDVIDVRVVENPLAEVRGSGLKAGLRLPGLYYVARTIRLDRVFIVRRGVPALAFGVREHPPLREVLISSADAAALARQLGNGRAA
jgi:hypothetical protein